MEYSWLTKCCVNFRCTAKWFSYTYTRIYSFSDSFPHLDCYRMLGRVPCEIRNFWTRYPTFSLSNEPWKLCRWLYSPTCMKEVIFTLSLNYLMTINIEADLHLIFVNSWNKYWSMFCIIVIRKNILLLFPLIIILNVHICPGLDIVPIFVSLNSSIIF